MRRLFKKKRNVNIDPNEIFLDSSNLPNFNVHQFEGRIEKPISKLTLSLAGIFFIFAQGLYLWKVGLLQIVQGKELRDRAENNRLEHSLIFGSRGMIYDRNQMPLAWNVLPDDSANWTDASSKEAKDGRALNEFPLRRYIDSPGFGHLLGYLSYPAKDSSGFYYKQDFEGKDGLEQSYNSDMNGLPGTKIQEVDALSRVRSESIIDPPVPGKDLVLSIDARVQKEMFRVISETANRVGFHAGAAAIMDIETGELLALTSFPEYSPQILTDGDDRDTIAKYQTDKEKPFLDRAVSGLYTPGSIVKPFVALGALNEGIITPEKKILSTGSITIPNPYFPDKPTVFKDWKAHGYVDMRDAIAVSSDVYFYEVGGGYKNEQKGLGIANIEKYMRLFGFGANTGIDIQGEALGVIPNPEWKAKNFDGAPWLLGNTYHTSIGQYGFQLTPIQAVRAAGVIASSGTLATPHLVKNAPAPTAQVDLPKKDFEVVQEGMRRGVLLGTATAMNIDSVKIAAKTGTAELGARKDAVNSWIIGFFPFDKPKYAFALVMERGPLHNPIGAPYVMRQVADFMAANTPEYFE